MRYYLNELKEGLIIAYKAMMANKMRSSLTTLGIIIGIVSVILMGTAMEGMDRAFNDSISQLGADVLYVQKWAWSTGDDWWKYRNRKDLLYEHTVSLKKQMSDAEVVSVCCWGGIHDIKYKGNIMYNISVLPTDENAAIAYGIFPKSGRFFTAFESEGGRPVCVIGSEIADGLFPREDPVGKNLKVRGQNYRIVGVIEKQGNNFFGGVGNDTRIYTPIKRHLQLYGSRIPMDNIAIKVSGDKAKIEETREEIRGLMRKIRKVPAWKEDDFAINQIEAFAKNFDTINVVISLVGFFITGLSLFVGSIGIMNVMFVSVTERTKEIGIRKALGAKRRTILIQFLIESAAISLLGGLIGLVIAYPISLLINRVMPASMPVSIIIIAIFVSLIIGVISGILPAMKASKLDPVEALRYE